MRPFPGGILELLHTEPCPTCRGECRRGLCACHDDREVTGSWRSTYRAWYTLILLLECPRRGRQGRSHRRHRGWCYCRRDVRTRRRLFFLGLSSVVKYCGRYVVGDGRYIVEDMLWVTLGILWKICCGRL